MVDSAAEKDGATPSAPAPSSEPGSGSPGSGAKGSVSKTSVDDGDEPESEVASPESDASAIPSHDGDITAPDETSKPAEEARDEPELDTIANGQSIHEEEIETLAGKAKTDATDSADQSGARAATPRRSPAASPPPARDAIPSDTSTAPKMPASGGGDPPGELAPAESDVPPPPRPSSGRRPTAKTVSLDTPSDALTSEAATEKRHAARRADSSDDIDASWGSPHKPGLPPRPRTPRPRPGSTTEASPVGTSPASLGLGARPLSKRPLSDPIDDAPTDDEPETAEASRPVGVVGPASMDPHDADATAALPPHHGAPSSLPSHGAAIAAATAPLGPTAVELHREDEDDPTIVNYPQGGADDERTAVHPSRGPFVAPIAGAQDDTPLEPKKTADFPPGFLAGSFSSREAAVEAALAAATGKQEDDAKPEREQQIVVAIATLLGVGMVLGALGAYLTARAVASGDADAGASLAGANVVCCISLFAAGFASLQPKQQARIGLCAASAAMLLIGFIWILGASIG